MVILQLEIAKCKDFSDITFYTPDAWENLSIIFNLLDNYLLYLVSIIKREAPLFEAENIIGEMIVNIRFVSLTLSKLLMSNIVNVGDASI